jgi:hypothetical protein
LAGRQSDDFLSSIAARKDRWQRTPYINNKLLLDRLLDRTVAAAFVWEPALYRGVAVAIAAASLPLPDRSQNIAVVAGPHLRAAGAAASLERISGATAHAKAAGGDPRTGVETMDGVSCIAVDLESDLAAQPDHYPTASAIATAAISKKRWHLPPPCCRPMRPDASSSPSTA